MISQCRHPHTKSAMSALAIEDIGLATSRAGRGCLYHPLLRAHIFKHHLNVLRSSPFCSQVHPGDVAAALFAPETTYEPIVLRSELARAFLRWTHCVHPYLRLLAPFRPSIGWKVSEKRLSLGLRIANGPCLHSPDMLCARAVHLQSR